MLHLSFSKNPQIWKPTDSQSHYATPGTGPIQTRNLCLQKVNFSLEHSCSCSSICAMLVYIQLTGGSWHKSLAAIFSFISLCSKSHYGGICYGPQGTDYSMTFNKLISLLVLYSNFSPRSQVAYHGAV